MEGRKSVDHKTLVQAMQFITPLPHYDPQAVQKFKTSHALYYTVALYHGFVEVSLPT
jgi:hypothetical protein